MRTKQGNILLAEVTSLVRPVQHHFDDRREASEGGTCFKYKLFHKTSPGVRTRSSQRGPRHLAGSSCGLARMGPHATDPRALFSGHRFIAVFVLLCTFAHAKGLA